MYNPSVQGATFVGGSGAFLLPNTNGNTTLTVIAITAIAVGSAIVLTSAARMIAKKVL